MPENHEKNKILDILDIFENLTFWKILEKKIKKKSKKNQKKKSKKKSRIKLKKQENSIKSTVFFPKLMFTMSTSTC